MVKIKKVALEEAPEEVKPSFPHPTLRHATLEDIPILIEIAMKTWKGSPVEVLELSESKVREKMEGMIVGGLQEFLCLVSHDEGKPVGALFAYAFEPLFSHDKIACEVLWYLEEDYRKSRRGLEMMQAYEMWAKMIGCKVAQYGWMISSPEKMPSLYKRTGAELYEHVYGKVLS